MTLRPRLVAPPTRRADPRIVAAMTAIERDWEQWRSPVAEVTNPDGWRPCDDLATNPLDVEGTLRRQYRIVAEPRLPLVRRVIRWVRDVGR